MRRYWRTATRQALIDWRGNRYSVPPELAASKVIVQQRLGAATIDIATLSGAVIARNRGSGSPSATPGTAARNASHPGPPLAALRDPDSCAYYDRKISQGKRHNQAVLALARRRFDVLFAMLREGTLYDAGSRSVAA